MGLVPDDRVLGVLHLERLAVDVPREPKDAGKERW